MKITRNMKNEVYCVFFTAHQFPWGSGNVLFFCISNPQASQVYCDAQCYLMSINPWMFFYIPPDNLYSKGKLFIQHSSFSYISFANCVMKQKYPQKMSIFISPFFPIFRRMRPALWSSSENIFSSKYSFFVRKKNKKTSLQFSTSFG